MTSDRLIMETKRVLGHSVESQKRIELGYTQMRLTVLAERSFSKKQECCTRKATNPIRDKIIPSGMTTWQVDLMPFIQHTYQKCTKKSCNNHARTLQSAGQSDSASKDGEGNAMKKFVPWSRNEVDGNRLRTPKKQIEYHPQNQNCSRDAQVARKRALGK